LSIYRLYQLFFLLLIGLLLAACGQAQPTEPLFYTVAPPTPPATIDQPATIDPVENTGGAASPSVQLTGVRLGLGRFVDLALSPDGDQFAVGTSIGVAVYDSQSFEPVWDSPTTSAVSQIAWSPDGDRIAAVLGDQLGIWDADSGELTGGCEYDSTVRHMAWSPDGNLIAAGLKDGTAVIWDAGEEQAIHTLSDGGTAWPVVNLAWSPDGVTLVVSYDEGSIILWDAVGGKYLRHIEGHEWLAARYLEFISGGRRLVTATGPADADAAASDRRAFVWDVETGIRVYVLGKRQGTVESLIRSPNGKLLATSRSDDNIDLWSDDGTLLLTLEGHTAGITALAISSDESMLASFAWKEAESTGELIVWETETGRVLNTTELPAALPVTQIEWLPDGSGLLLLSVDGLSLLEFDGEELQLQDRLEGSSEIDSIAFSPDGSLLAAGANNGVVIWDMATQEPIHTLNQITGGKTSLAWSPDGVLLAVAGPEQINLWDAQSGEYLLAFEGGGDNLDWSADGSLLAYFTAGQVIIADVQTGRVLQTIGEASPGLAFRPDGLVLAVGRFDGDVVAWDLTAAGGKPVEYVRFEGHSWGVLSTTWSPDGRLLATGPGINDTTFDVIVWDAKTGQPVHHLVGHQQPVFALDFSPDGSLLASGSGESNGTLSDHPGQLLVWNLETGALAHTLPGHTGRVTGVDFSADGAWLASGSSDGTVMLWPVGP
jgi:WD40 repeat protein